MLFVIAAERRTNDVAIGEGGGGGDRTRGRRKKPDAPTYAGATSAALAARASALAVSGPFSLSLPYALPRSPTHLAASSGRNSRLYGDARRLPFPFAAAGTHSTPLSHALGRSDAGAPSGVFVVATARQLCPSYVDRLFSFGASRRLCCRIPGSSSATRAFRSAQTMKRIVRVAGDTTRCCLASSLPNRLSLSLSTLP